MRIAKNCLAVFWLASTAVGWSQPDWGQTHLPANTQFYLEYQPRVQLSKGPSVGERLRRSPLTRVLVKALKLTPGQTSELANLPYWDGRMILGITRQGDLSPFELYERAENRRSRVSELRYAAEQAFEGVNLYRRFQKRFPTTVEDLSREEHFDLDLIPSGAELALVREGKKVSVVATWDDLQVRWPEIDSSDPPPTQEYGGLLLAMGCPQAQNVRPWLERWDTKMEELSYAEDHWKLTFEGHDFHIYLDKNWLYLSNQPALAQAFLQSKPPTESLKSNPRFAEQAGRLNAADTEFWSFVDLQDVLQTSPGLCAKMGIEPNRVLLRSAAMTSGSHLDASGQLEVHSAGFLQWDGVQNVTLGPASAATLGTKIPAGAENVYWLDIPGWVRTADRLGGEFAVAGMGLEMGWAELEKVLGFPVPREALGRGAEVFLYTEVVDSYAAQLELLIEMMQDFMSMGDDQEEESPESPDFGVSKFPLLAVLEVADKGLNKQIQDKLKDRLGSQRTAQKHEGVNYLLSSDGRCAWAGNETAQFWANGYTERLLPPVFNAYRGQGPNLASLPSYQLFQAGRQGELLAYFHAKVDREYSLMKALLLYLGSDFRPEAEILGRLRDSYMSLEVVPGGIRLRSSVYSEGVRAPKAEPEEE